MTTSLKDRTSSAMALYRLHKLARKAARRLPNRLVHAVKSNRWGRVLWRGMPGPTVSVIVPVYNVEDYLAKCLDSLLKQTLRRMEIIVVNDGSTDRSAAILASYARRDRRVKVITQPNAGLGAARNAGIAIATAPYITFLDSDDMVPPGAYELMVKSLRRTRSDFAVGAVSRISHGKSSRPPWVLNVHRVQRLHITIDDFPDAMQDVIACNRMFRRKFWNERIGPFPTGIAYEDHAPMVSAYVRATAFDLLTSTTYIWRIRENASSIGQQKHQIRNLIDRVAVKDLAWAVVSTEASDEVIAAWLGRVLDIDLSLFVEYAIYADEEYRQVLQVAAQRFSERADDAAWRHVRVDRKLRIALAAAGQWQLADRFIEFTRLNGVLPSTIVSDGRVYADLPLATELQLSPALYELSEHQTSLSACVQRAIWNDDGKLLIRGWGFVRAVDLTDEVPVIKAWLRHPPTGEQVSVPVNHFFDPVITRWANHPNHRYDSAGFEITVEVDSLVPLMTDTDQARARVRWQLVLEVTSRGVTRTGSVHGLLSAGQAKRMGPRYLADVNDPRRFTPVMDNTLGFALEIRNDLVRATELFVDGRNLHGSVAILRPLAHPPRALRLVQQNRIVATTSLVEQPDGSWMFDLMVPPAGARGLVGAIRLVDDSGKSHRVAWPVEGTFGTEIGPWGPGCVRWSRSGIGFVQVTSTLARLQVLSVDITATEVTLEVQPDGLAPELLQGAELRSSAAVCGVHLVEPISSDRYRLVFPTTRPIWGASDRRALPTGTYVLQLPIDDDRVIPASIANHVFDVIPMERLTAMHGATVARVPGTKRFTLALRAPLKDDERGRVSQRRLAQWYREAEFTPTDQVVFQCYRGEFATDSQRALHEELFRQRVPLELLWGIYDLSTELPEGAVPVLIGSRRWYEALGRARYLCNNIDFDRFFQRRPYQKFLQTFHGYPFKSMGISFWRTKNFSDDVISAECERRNAAWTSILVPAPFCEEVYRREYAYEGEVLVTGYPRDDALVDPDPDARAAILARLGIPTSKRVILYAPTWREHSATGAWSARFFDALNIDELSNALGDEHVLLLRGHNYNLRDGVLKSRHAAVIDVTRYPEINDLILAADVAVLDYSSLRFDWVLTGKPLLFFVPDLASYLSQRTALFEYAPTAPGPMLFSTAEVIDAVKNLDSVSAKYAEARHLCNQEFNALHDGKATQRVVEAFFN